MNNSNILDSYIKMIKQKSFKDKPVLDLCEKIGESLKKNSNTQMRKFYDGLKTIARKGQNKQIDPYVQLTLYKSRVMYSAARKGGMNNQLRRFLVKSVDTILDKEQQEMTVALQDFMDYFEAVYGYYFYASENR